LHALAGTQHPPKRSEEHGALPHRLAWSAWVIVLVASVVIVLAVAAS